MRLVFIVNDARAERAGHGTAHLALAAHRRGHEVGFVAVDDLSLRADNDVSAVIRRVSGSPSTVDELVAGLAADDAAVSRASLAGCDVVFLRFHPHREARTPHSPLIDFGWRLKLAGVAVVNDPEGTQRAGGRMYLGGLPAELRPRTLVTRDPARVKAFLAELHAEAVVKPLAERHAGAENVFRIRRGEKKNLNQILELLRKTGYIVAQEWLPERADGEKRLLLLGGEPVRDPASGRVAIYRRNGDGSREGCEISSSDQRIVESLRPRLEADGLYFVAADIVGDKLLGLHVYTPGGLRANLELYGLDVGAEVIRDLERRVEVRRAYRALERPA